MKKLFWLMTVMVGLVLGHEVSAQEAAKKQPLEILSDYFEFSTTNHIAVFKGNVIVNDPPETKIHCDELTVHLTADNSRLEVIYAEGNVKIDVVDKDGKKTATGKHATFDVQANVLTLTGDPTITTSFGTLKDAEKVILDRANGVMKTIGRNRMTIDQQSLEKSGPKK